MQKIQKRLHCRHLNEKQRDRLHALYLDGYQQKHIAEVLGVNPGTISRELHRYGKTTWRYSSVRAQKDAEEKRAKSKRDGMKIEKYPELKQRIIKELKASISGRNSWPYER